jgi:predicted nucleotidyltransferase
VRLSNEEIATLKQTLNSLSSDALLYLFGSRVDDSKKGGDIDLLVVSPSLSQQDMRILRVEFQKRFGEQKMDILLDDGRFDNVFHKIILEKAVPL